MRNSLAVGSDGRRDGGVAAPAWSAQPRGATIALVGALVLSLAAGCATPGGGSHPDTQASGRQPLTAADLQWLDRITFGIDSRSRVDLERLGRDRFLEEQLGADDPILPATVAKDLATLEVTHLDVEKELVAVRREHKRIRELTDPAAQQTAREALNERGRRLENEAAQRLVFRSIYSQDQLREQMVWFWLNHFSVFQHKAELRWLVGDYETRAIRPHALGHFRDLVIATLQHPAMLQYLDNAQNAVGHVNENYARELMELHTLGVAGGYTQQDVQDLARVLTGVGVWNGADAPRARRDRQALYRRHGAMEFIPARHDFGAKVLLGRPIRSQGFGEVEEAVDRLVRSPACAHFVSRRLAEYFVSDQPADELVERLATEFQRTDGDIAAVLRMLFRSPDLEASLAHKFRDPYHYVVGALRFAYDGRPITNSRPPLNWLNTLGEAPYNHPTPDGYSLSSDGWSSSGQLSRRFEIGRAIGAGNAGPLDPQPGQPAAVGFRRLSTQLYYTAIEPRLAPKTRDALEHATSQLEWNTLLLASPELNYR